MSKLAAATRARQVLESVKAVISSGQLTGISEADTRAHFIDALLAALGYAVYGEIQREVYVKDTKDFLDYLLLIDGKPRIAVEAKRLSHTLTETDGGQLIQYCSILGIEWAVLTNAREWRLYHQYAHGPLADKLVFQLSLVGWAADDEFQALFDQLWLVSRDAFLGEDGPMAWLRAQRLDAALRDALADPASLEVKYLRNRLAQQQIQASTADVAAWFKARLLDPSAVPTPGAPPAAVPTPAAIATPAANATPASLPPAHSGAPTAAQILKAPSRVDNQHQEGVPEYWLVPSGVRKDATASESVARWLAHGMWGMWESTPGRKAVKPGDWIALNATGEGVVAFGRLTGTADVLLAEHDLPEPQEKPTYRVPLSDIQWVRPPVVIDAAVRAALDAFQGRDPHTGWGWLVQTSRRISRNDFLRLTRQSS